MSVKQVISDHRNIVASFPASTAIANGDLLYWNSTAVAKASAQADQLSESANQALFASLFFGVSLDQRLSTETTAADRVVVADGIFDCSCDSTTWAVGDLVAAVEDSGGTFLELQKVKKVTDPSLAIGYAIKAGTSVTTVRCRLISRYLPNTIRAPFLGGASGGTLLVGSALAQTVSNGDGTTALSPSAQVLGTTKATSSLLLADFSATATSVAAPSLDFLKSANAAIGGNTVVASGEVLGEVNFFGADGTDFKSCAVSLRALVDATPGTGDMPGRFVVFTSADGAETPLEKMRVTGAAATATVTVGVAGTSTGTLSLSGATSGTVGLVAQAAAGSITFALPAVVGTAGQQLATDGTATNAVTSWAAAGSLRAFKDLLGSLRDRAGEALSRVLAADVQAFRYKDRSPPESGEIVTTGDVKTVYQGVLGDDYPEVMHHSGKIFNPVSAFGEMVLAMQALAARLERLEGAS